MLIVIKSKIKIFTTNAKEKEFIIFKTFSGRRTGFDDSNIIKNKIEKGFHIHFVVVVVVNFSVAHTHARVCVWHIGLCGIVLLFLSTAQHWQKISRRRSVATCHRCQSRNAELDSRLKLA